jgi:cold shock CspA family protein
MSSEASALVQILAEHQDDDILQALQMLISQRPALQAQISEVMQFERPKRYTGVISAFLESKRFGFIKSDEVTNEYGMDTFLSDKELGPFQVGSWVTFCLALNKEGKPQARLLEAVAEDEQPAQPHMPVYVPPPAKRPYEQGSHDSLAPTRKPRHVAPIGAAPIGAAPIGAFGAVATAVHCQDTRYVGAIHHFQADRRYGFISCDDVTAMFGMDTFLSNMEIGDFNNGDVVSFSIEVNKQGKPQARQLAVPENGGLA